MRKSEVITRRRRRGTITATAALVLAMIGMTLVAIAVSEEPFLFARQRTEPPLVTSPGITTPENAEKRDSSTATPDQHGPPNALPPSEPVAIDIPAINVHSSMLRLDTRQDGSIEVPPYEPNSRTGWYEDSPTPGERGPAVILGHVDSVKYGPGIFHELGRLRAGDVVTVDRADGTTAVFRVTRTERYPKDAFPTFKVYGNIDHPGLRLITCGGDFHAEQGNYEDNVVSYATLVDHHPTR